MTFDELDLDPGVLDGLDAMNFLEPSPIQLRAIPEILLGNDLIACAQTGTGKTAAFVLPLLSLLSSGDYPSTHINAVIMAPTRELAQQIDQQIEAFSYFVNVSAVPVYGGTGGAEWDQQKRGLRLGADIIVATPGRLLSHLNLRTVDLSQVSFFVLDEADRMLDMGFYDDIIKISREMPDTVQTIMFSATMPPKIRKMAKEIMRTPKEINIAVSRPPESINQTAYLCHSQDKTALLLELMKAHAEDRCLIFVASKERVKDLRRQLSMRGYSVKEMHSDLDQSVREEVMRDFKGGVVKQIVATDIISRGIDVDDIDLIVNFDVPGDSEDYVHRIGRTSRGRNQGGAAITIVSEKDLSSFRHIEEFLGYSITLNLLPQNIRPHLQRDSHDKPQRSHRERKNNGIGSPKTQGASAKKWKRSKSKRKYSQSETKGASAKDGAKKKRTE